MDLKVAVIGVGNMGRHHARLYSEIAGCKLVAVADLDETTGRAIAEKTGCNYHKNYHEMLQKERPDIVSVCVPTSLHYQVAKDVIEAGINVIVEKPVTNDLKSAQELVQLAKQKGVKFTVGHVERFNPAVRKLKEFVDKGIFGDITSILAQRVGLFPSQIKDANVIIDVAIHDIDIFNYILNKEPQKVFFGSGKAINDKRDDYADIFLKYNGTNGFIEVNWITPVKIRMLTVTGTKGFAQLNYITQSLTLYKSSYEKNYDQFGDFVVKFGSPEREEVQIHKTEPLKNELEHFVDCVANNKEPLVSGEDAIKALKVALNLI